MHQPYCSVLQAGHPRLVVIEFAITEDIDTAAIIIIVFAVCDVFDVIIIAFSLRLS